MNLTRPASAPLARVAIVAVFAVFAVFAIFATAVLLVAWPATGFAQAERPNIVLIVGDDHGWPYSGFMGDPYVQTPHLDALAAGGTVFANGHVTSSVCAPSLRAVLAGIHTVQWESERVAIEAAQSSAFARRQEVTHYRTLPRELRRRGYLSWEGGKMWEGTFAQAGFTHGLATYVGGPLFIVGDDFGRTGFTEGTALDPLRTFLDQAGETPFFVWFAPALPHGPYNAPAALRLPYQGLGLAPIEVNYYANVSWLDAVVGELVTELEARGLRDDTLLVYVSDNGIGITQTTVGEGKGKGTLYELGFRTPLVFNWPGHVPGGVVRDDLVSSLDLVPTLLDYAGADPVPDRSGISLQRAVATGAPVGRDKIVSHHGGPQPYNSGFWVRTPEWRYIAFDDGREELYAIADDPHENLDVAAEHAELLPAFRADVAEWSADLTRVPERLDAAGRLTDDSGTGIEGAELQLRGRTDHGELLRLRVVTSPDGDFRFEALPHGDYMLTAVRRATALRQGIFAGRIPLRLPTGTLGTHSPLRAHTQEWNPGTHTGTIRGVLRSDAGAPFEGAIVTLRGKAGKPVLAVLRSDAQGRYRAENLPPGSYAVTVNAGRAYRRVRGRLMLTAGGDLVNDLTLIAR